MKIVAKILSITILTLFLGAMFSSLLHTPSHMGMSGDIEMTNCPFMSHDSALCEMNLASHVGAWKTTFLAIIPILNILLMSLGSLVLIISFTSNIFSRSKYIEPRIFNYIKECTFIYRPLQNLFSQGILHTKLF